MNTLTPLPPPPTPLPTTQSPPSTIALKDDCCQCHNSAVHYDSQGQGYCLSHWHGDYFEPGQECAELMKWDGLSYWVRGTVIIDKPKGKTTRGGAVWAKRVKGSRPNVKDKCRLLPIRYGMPKVKLWNFEDVFVMPDYSVPVESVRLDVDLAAIEEDRQEALELGIDAPCIDEGEE